METARAANVPYYFAIAQLVAAWAAGDGPAKIAAAFEPLMKSGAIMFHSVYALMKAEAHAALGEWEQSLASTDDGITCAIEHDEMYFISELHRVRAAALSALGRRAEAIASREAAIEYARGQGALLFERRAEEALPDLDRTAMASEA